MAGPVADKIILPSDTGNTGKKVRTQTRVVGADTVHEHFFVQARAARVLNVYRFALDEVSGGTDGTATGALLLASAQAADGVVATGAAAQAGTTIAATASVVSGQTTGAAASSGGVLDASLVVIVGAPTGDAGVVGVFLTTAANAVSGNGTGGGSATGVVLSHSTSVIDEGAETGGGGTGTETLVSVASVVAGTAVGPAEVPGVVQVAAAVGIVAGEPSGGADIEGLALQSTTSVFAGDAWGEGEPPGAEIIVPAFLMAGLGSGDGVIADGVTIAVPASMSEGSAASAQSPPAQSQSSGSVGGGRPHSRTTRRTVPEFFEPFVQDASIKGVTITAQVSLVGGRATGDSVAKGAPASPSALLIAGTVSASSCIPLTTLRTRMRIIQGHTRIDAKVHPVALACRVSFQSGRAEGFDTITYDNDLITLIAA